MSLSLVPVPASVHEGDGPPFLIADGVGITGDAAASAVLADLIAVRTGAQLRTTRGGGMPLPGVSGTISAAVQDGAAREASIDLRITPGGAPESYRLAVDAASITVDGADPAGLFYGVQTLGQLIERTGDGWAVPAVEISDSPRYAYRGVMLDVARHFFPVEDVTAYIDRAAGLKLNHLHLHLADDQGWRLHIHSRPLLTQRASGTAVGGDAGGFYTPDDYRAIVAHAASRHMTVVPEIDLPGHTHAIGLAYPELVEEPVITTEMREVAGHLGEALPAPGEPYTGVLVGFSSVTIHDEQTYSFLADVLGEIADLTPGPYLHLGGDECLGTDPADFAMFFQRVTRLVSGLGKTPIAWHEAGAAPGLAPGTIGQYWGATTPSRGLDPGVPAFVRNGGRIIASPSDAIYLDMKPELDWPIGALWADGPTTVASAYGWDPLTVLDGLDEADILGVEAPMWTETIRSLADVDAMAFPRISAAAEIAWSPAPGRSDARTWDSFSRRVAGLGPLWTSLGIGFPPLAEIPWTRE